MTQYSTDLRARLTRERLAALWAATYALLRGLDVNDACLRLEAAFRDPRLLADHQDAVVAALRARLPGADDAQLVVKIDKRERSGRRFPAPRGRTDSGGWVAWSLALDRSAGVGSGEADALLGTPDGRRLLSEGLALAADHGAERLLK